MTDLRQILYFSSLLLLVCGCLSSLPTPQNYISKCAATCEPVLSVTHSFLRLFLYLIQLLWYEINLTWTNCYILQYLNTCQQFYTCLLILSELQSQFLCVKVLFLVPCVRKTQTVISPYGRDSCVYTVNICSFRWCVRSVGSAATALSNWYGGTTHCRHQTFLDCDNRLCGRNEGLLL